MAVEKKTTKKAPTKKAVAVKPVAPKAAAKRASASAKVAADKPAKKAVAQKTSVSQEKFYAMVSEAAYFAAQNDGSRKGAVEYWMDAEAAVRAKFDVA